MDWWIGGLVGWWVDGLMGWWVGGLVSWWVGVVASPIVFTSIPMEITYCFQPKKFQLPIVIPPIFS